MEYPFIDELKYDAAGLIPAVIQDLETKQVLMVAYMNRDSIKQTMETGLTSFWSRSRQKYWIKGESSGHTQEVREMYTDCDKDTLVILVKQNGAACHEGFYSCFFRKIEKDGSITEIGSRLFNPDDVYKKK